MTKKQKLVVEKYLERLNNIKSEYCFDNEVAHGVADDSLLEALRELGFPELADAWQDVCSEVGFWYA